MIRSAVKKFLYLLLTFLTFSCNALPPPVLGFYAYTNRPPIQSVPKQIFPIYIDNHFGETDKRYIAQALDQWNYALNNQAAFIMHENLVPDPEEVSTILHQGGFVILAINSQDPEVSMIDKKMPAGVWTLAFTSLVGGHRICLVRNRIGMSKDLYYIVMHEVGHTLGANHTQHGLMAPEFVPAEYQCPDKGVMQQVATVQHWPLATLNYCLPRPIDN